MAGNTRSIALIDDPAEFYSLTQMFEFFCEAHGFRTAVIHRDQQLDYIALNGYANRIAHALLALQRQSGHRLTERSAIGICLERSHHSVAAMLGILKAGFCVLPLNPAYSAASLASLLPDGHNGELHILTVSATLANQQQWFKHPDLKIIPHCLDLEFARRQSIDNPQLVSNGASDRWIASADSGTTGCPTGIHVDSIGINKLIRAFDATWVCDNTQYLLHTSDIWSTRTFTECLLPLCSGAGVVVQPEVVSELSDNFLDIIQQSNTTFLQIDSSHWNKLATTLLESQQLLPACVETVIIRHDLKRDVGNNKLSAQTEDPRRVTSSATRIDHVFGLEEASLYTLVKSCVEADGKRRAGHNLIGKPLPESCVRVLNESGDEVAPGEPGVLYIANSNSPGRAPQSERLVNTGILARKILTGEFEIVTIG